MAETGGTVVFAGDARPLDFGVLVAAWRGSLDELVTDTGGQMEPDEIIAKRGHWELKLALAFDLAIADQREWLPPRQDGYVVRLVVGADDGAARTYDVDIDWDGTAPGAAAALASVEIAVREVRSGSS